MMKIEFYDVTTGNTIEDKYGMYFIRGNGEVWADNGNYWESQSASIGFDDCIIHCPNVGWRIIK